MELEKSSASLNASLQEFREFLLHWRGHSINDEIFNRENETDERFLPFHESPPNRISSLDLIGFVLEWARQILHNLHCPSPYAESIARLLVENYYGDVNLDTEQELEASEALWRKVVSELDSVLQELSAYDPDELLLEDRWSSFNENTAKCSVYAIKNGRRTMEDLHVVIPEINPLMGNDFDPPTAYYAVFDGHAGNKAACYAATHLHHKITNIPTYRSNIKEAVRQGIKETDAGFNNQCSYSDKNCKSGCTAVCCFIRPDKLWLAWVGDSQGMIFSGGKPTYITTPHRPERQDERQRIEDLGGCVVHMGTWRVNGTLAVSRAIGDIENKPFVSAEPDVIEIDLKGSEDFVILACDGMWDVLNDEDVSNIAYAYFGTYANESDGEGLSSRLVTEAKKRASTDNITVVVVYLQDYAVLHETYSHLKLSETVAETSSDITEDNDRLLDFSTEPQSQEFTGFSFSHSRQAEQTSITTTTYSQSSEFSEQWNNSSKTVTTGFGGFTDNFEEMEAQFGQPLKDPSEPVTEFTDKTDFIENTGVTYVEKSSSENKGSFFVGDDVIERHFESDVVDESSAASKKTYLESTLSPEAEPFVSKLYSNDQFNQQMQNFSEGNFVVKEEVSSYFVDEPLKVQQEKFVDEPQKVQQEKSSNPFENNQYSVLENQEIYDDDDDVQFQNKSASEFEAELQQDEAAADLIEAEEVQDVHTEEIKVDRYVDDYFKDTNKTGQNLIFEAELQQDEAVTADLFGAEKVHEIHTEEITSDKFVDDYFKERNELGQNLVFDADIMIPEVKMVYSENVTVSDAENVAVESHSFENTELISDEVESKPSEVVSLFDIEQHQFEPPSAPQQELLSPIVDVAAELHEEISPAVEQPKFDQSEENPLMYEYLSQPELVPLNESATSYEADSQEDISHEEASSTADSDHLAEVEKDEYEIITEQQPESHLELPQHEDVNGHVVASPTFEIKSEEVEIESLSPVPQPELSAFSLETEVVVNDEFEEQQQHFVEETIKSPETEPMTSPIEAAVEPIANEPVEEKLQVIETIPAAIAAALDVEDDESEDGEGWKFYPPENKTAEVVTNGDGKLHDENIELVAPVEIPKEHVELPPVEAELIFQEPIPTLPELVAVEPSPVVAAAPVSVVEPAKAPKPAAAKSSTKIKSATSKTSKPETTTKSTSASSKSSATLKTSTSATTKDVKKPLSASKSATAPAKPKPAADAKSTETVKAKTTTVAAKVTLARKPLATKTTSVTATTTKPSTNGTPNGHAVKEASVAKTSTKTIESTIKSATTIAKKSTTTTKPPLTAPLKKPLAPKTAISTTTTATKKASTTSTISATRSSTVSATKSSTTTVTTSKVSTASPAKLSCTTTATLTSITQGATRPDAKKTNKDLSNIRLSKSRMQPKVDVHETGPNHEKAMIGSPPSSTTSSNNTKTSKKKEETSILKRAVLEPYKITTTTTKSPIAGPSARLTPSKTPPAARSSPKAASPTTPKARTVTASKTPTSASKTNRLASTTPAKAHSPLKKISKANQLEKGTIDAQSKDEVKLKNGNCEKEVAVVGEPKIELELQNGFGKLSNGDHESSGDFHNSSANESIIDTEAMLSAQSDLFLA